MSRRRATCPVWVVSCVPPGGGDAVAVPHASQVLALEGGLQLPLQPGVRHHRLLEALGRVGDARCGPLSFRLYRAIRAASRSCRRTRGGERLFHVVFLSDTPAGKAFDVALIVAILVYVLIRFVLRTPFGAGTGTGYGAAFDPTLGGLVEVDR